MVVRKDCSLPLLTFLKEHHCDLNATTLHKKDTAILIAVALNQPETVKYLIRNGAEVNRGDGPINRIPPLVFAVQRKKEGVVEILLTAKNIDLNVRDDNETPIIMLCARQLPECVKKLLEAGADPNVVDKYGRTLLTLFSAATQYTELIELLVQHGADVNKRDNYSNTVPLLRPVRRGRFNFSCEGEY